MIEDSNWTIESSEAAPASNKRVRLLAVVVIALTLVGGAALMAAFLRPSKETAAMFTKGPIARPVEHSANGYVGSEVCRECHEREHATWHDSYHRTMTQIASEQAVVGNFNNTEVEADGKLFRLGKDNQGYWAEFENPPNEGENQEEPERIRRYVVLCTGSHHMQVYWLSTGRGRELAALPVMWLIREQRWIPRSAGFLQPSYKNLGMPDEVIARTIFEQGRWNDTCILCHTTAGRTIIRDTPESTVAEFGISCEACHGPGESHVRLHESNSEFIGHDPIVLPPALDRDRSVEVCGQCHSISFQASFDKATDTTKIGKTYRPGQRLADTLHIETTEHHTPKNSWADGMVRIVGREYNSLLDSPCYQRGQLTCFSCHQMHQAADDDRSREAWADDQLQPNMRTNEACLQCHQEYRSEDFLTEHTHHSPASHGSQCMNCHMPNTAYGLLKATRSHQISNPSVQETLSTGRPNACNACHLDKSLGWSGKHLAEWYGHPSLGEETESKVAGAVQMVLKGDATVRALAAWHMGWTPAREASGDDWMPPYLAILMEDEYDAVRFIAHRSLHRISGYADINYDFVSSHAQRQRACEQIKNRWSSQVDRSTKNNPSLLIADGELETRLIDYLLRDRDRQRVYLNE